MVCALNLGRKQGLWTRLKVINFHFHPYLKIGTKMEILDTRCCRRRRLKGIYSRSDTNRTGAEGLFFYYPRLLHCLNQMLAVMLLIQHGVSSSKTVRPRASSGARCIGHAVSTWSAVCSEAPHSQFGEGARPYLCMDKWNRPTQIGVMFLDKVKTVLDTDWEL